MPTSDLHKPAPRPGNLLIRNVTVVGPDALHPGCDILIQKGVIAQIGVSIPEPLETQVLDGEDALAMPGALDLHVHFREPSNNHAEDLGSGSYAAAAGGVTGFADMPNTHPLTMPGDRLKAKMALAEERCATDYSFYVTLDPRENPRLLWDAVDPHTIPGFKAFLGGTTAAEALSEEDWAALCLAAQAHDLPITVHAEDDEILAENAAWLKRRGYTPENASWYHALYRDAVACVASTCRALRAARRYDIHIHIAHVTTAAEVELIRAAKRDGVRVTAETTLHHLWFCHEGGCYHEHGHEVKCNPSIKYLRDQQALLEGLRRGTIDMIGTDHAPHLDKGPGAGAPPYDKAPSGVASAVEYVLPLLLQEMEEKTIGFGDCTILDVANWTARNPARIFGVERKGALAPGFDGDVVLIPPRTQAVTRPVVSKRGHSPWETTKLKTWPAATFLRGEPVYVNNGWKGLKEVPGRGRPLRFDHPRVDS